MGVKSLLGSSVETHRVEGSKPGSALGRCLWGGACDLCYHPAMSARWPVLKPCQGLYLQVEALAGHGSALKPVELVHQPRCRLPLHISHKIPSSALCLGSHHSLSHPWLWGVGDDGRQSGGRRRLCSSAEPLLFPRRCPSGWMERTKLWSTTPWGSPRTPSGWCSGAPGSVTCSTATGTKSPSASRPRLSPST